MAERGKPLAPAQRKARTAAAAACPQGSARGDWLGACTAADVSSVRSDSIKSQASRQCGEGLESRRLWRLSALHPPPGACPKLTHL